MAAGSKAKGLIGSVIFGLIFAGLGVWTLVDPTHANEMGHSDTGRSKTRMVKAVLGWMYDTIGVMPTGILLILVGVALIGLAIRGAMTKPHATAG